jgi:hypothetical protein
VPALLDEADHRGNLYTQTTLRTRMVHYLWLAADDPQASRHEADEAMKLWTHRGFHLQHFNALLARTQTDLYDRKGEAAFDQVDEMWGPMKRSLLLRVQVIEIEALHLRARSAVAACGGSDAGRLLRLAEHDARRIERHRMVWSDPLAALVRAGIAARCGDSERAVRLLSGAAAAFDAADMALHAAAARHQWGVLIGGAEGEELVRTAESWMNGQMIKNPARMSAMLVPGIVE